MRKLALALAVTGSLALSTIATPALAWVETPEATAEATDAADAAHADMVATFGVDRLMPGHYLWDDEVGTGDPRVIVSLSNQMAYLYRGDRLAAVTTISSGKPGKDTPTGYFPILEKKPMHRSVKYDNAPMPHMQRLDNYGIALHAGMLPGRPASHGCVRLPAKFAAKLFTVTKVGTLVLIGS
ncbi:L,D-transpeptidase family protein [Sphingomonas sp.]|uniref:L,D-transpeptidase family protein n=1 Tax=Sphingomonas sp. TaxID=28214 RepID=UPI00286D1D2B|nr:L,D-transpeptidase family protein [Sphingomonas sp.]